MKINTISGNGVDVLGIQTRVLCELAWNKMIWNKEVKWFFSEILMWSLRYKAATYPPVVVKNIITKKSYLQHMRKKDFRLYIFFVLSVLRSKFSKKLTTSMKKPKLLFLCRFAKLGFFDFKYFFYDVCIDIRRLQSYIFKTNY